MEINNEQLISAVFIRAPLWDQKNKNYHNRIVLDKNWEEVSLELKEERDVLKKRWKNLRDQFRIELKKITPEQTGDAGCVDDSCIYWPYFKSMYFLRDQMKCRPLIGKFKSKRTSDKNLEQVSLDQEEEVNLEQDEPGCSKNYNIKNNRTKLQKIKYNIPQTNDGEIIKTKLQLLEQKYKLRKEKDEDESFFDSMLPHVRKLSPSQKLIFRMEVQSIVHGLLYNPSQSSTITARYIFHADGVDGPQQKDNRPLVETNETETIKSEVFEIGINNETK